MTILLLEDEKLVRDVIVSMLAGAGLTVLQAETAEEALAKGALFPDIPLLITDHSARRHERTPGRGAAPPR